MVYNTAVHSQDTNSTFPPQRPTQIFAGNPLDRGEDERRDEEWLARMERSPDSRFLCLNKMKAPLINDGGDERLYWTDRNALDAMGVKAQPYLLGLRDGICHFAIDITEFGASVEGMPAAAPITFVDVRSAATRLPVPEAGILCQATAQVNWHASHRFCSACGQPSSIRRGGQMRQCPSCERLHFPRIDPVVISVVYHGDLCLLGQSRGRMRRLNTYSCLAGFVDQGETLEEAVAREIMEEAGIIVDDVRYLFSQPWPFPHTLMIGCQAQAATTEIRRDDVEMEDVQWFARGEVIAALEGRNDSLLLPGPIAIAHHLIKTWAYS